MRLCGSLALHPYLNRRGIEKMIGIVLATHGKIGTGLLSGAEAILGKQSQIRVLELDETDNLEIFSRKMAEAIAEIDDGDGVLVLADLMGGTPANAALLNLHTRNSDAVSGVNLAMLLEALLNRDTLDLPELTEAAILAGVNGIKRLNIGEQQVGNI